MSFGTGQTSDYFRYGPHEFLDTFHNRVSALAVESVLTVAKRSHLLTNRSMFFFMDFVINNLGRFTVLSEDPLHDVMEMWFKAGGTPTGSEQEFMIDVLLEVHSYFSAQSMGLSDNFRNYLKALYPQLTAKKISSETPITEPQGAFNLSYVFVELPFETLANQLLSTTYSWALPWMILSHTDQFMVETLISRIEALRGPGGDA